MDLDRRKLFTAATATIPLLVSSRSPSDAVGSVPQLGPLYLKQFGATLDGLSDDTEAVQRALDSCLTTSPARSLVVNGMCRLERQVFIDRRVDTTRGVLRIVGEGGFGGFVAAGDFPLFESRLEHATAPQSEHISFDNVRFEALPTAAKASVLSDKFLRVRFNDCEFERIAALRGGKYAQEWQFSRCIAKNWSGRFFSSHGGYHITSSGGKYQNGGGTVFDIVEPSLRNAGCVGCAFHQDVVEANTGSFLRGAVVQGLSVAGIYSESNLGPTFDFDNAAPNRGISITGCMFAPKDENKADPAFYDIRWGRIEGGYSGGNYSTGRLHHVQSLTTARPTIAGDFALLQLLSHGR